MESEPIVIMRLIMASALEEEMATHSSVLAWKIPWTKEPGGLQSMGLQSQTRLSTHSSPASAKEKQ